MKDLRDLTETFTDIDTAKQSESNILYNNKYYNNKDNIYHISDTGVADETNTSSTSIGRASLEASPPNVVFVGATMHQPLKKSPERRKFNFTIGTSNGMTSQFTANMAHYTRKRELTSNVPDEHANWFGYEEAIEHMGKLDNPQESYVGKLKPKAVWEKGKPSSNSITPETVVVYWLDEQDAHLLLWLGNEQIHITLGNTLSKKQQMHFVASGYYKKEKEQFGKKVF